MHEQVVVVDRLMAWSCRCRFHRWCLLPGRIPCDHARIGKPSPESAEAASPGPRLASGGPRHDSRRIADEGELRVLLPVLAVACWREGLERFGQGAGHGYAAVQAGEVEQPQDVVAAAYHIHGDTVRGGLRGRAAQGA